MHKDWCGNRVVIAKILAASTKVSLVALTASTLEQTESTQAPNVKNVTLYRYIEC